MNYTIRYDKESDCIVTDITEISKSVTFTKTDLSLLLESGLYEQHIFRDDAIARTLEEKEGEDNGK